MKKAVVLILILSLAGLGAIQYRFLQIGLKYAKARFDQQMGQAMQAAQQGLYPETQLTVLLAAIVTGEQGNFQLGVDTLADAGRNFFKDYLKDRMLGKGVNVDFDFALTDVPGKNSYLQSAGYVASSDFMDYQAPVNGYISEQCQCNLYLHVKAHNLLSYLLGQLNVLIILNVAFFGLVAFCFLWLIYLLRQQATLDEVKNDFINNLTHELKTPVFTIGMTAKMLQERCTSDKDLQYLEIIREENELLKKHIDKVLELASMENGRQAVERQVLDVHEVLEEAVAGFRLKVEQQKGSFTFRREAENAIAFIDPVHLGNAVHNLLDNALKYSAPPVEIELHTYNKSGKLCIAVKDKGKGIGSEHKDRVFRKFYRVPDGDVHEVKGFGLGLSYVRQAVRMHQGEALLDSTPGKGSTFTIVLPLHH
ncbi:MAG: HAMP domain-containing histidine kinase [Lewinellaceae bacterium]|nr:HAMP domain-containing histidine kinase [Lewinellaceae bacterium]